MITTFLIGILLKLALVILGFFLGVCFMLFLIALKSDEDVLYVSDVEEDGGKP